MNLAPIMFGGLIVFLLLGFPVSFSLAANGLFFALLGYALGEFSPALLGALPLRLFGIMQNETLLAIPFFTFMGVVLERSGMAEDLLDTVGQIFGRIRGGLAYAVIFVGALLAATTGVVAASVIAMGLISLPIMLRYGYDRKLAAGAIMASGTLAQIIPPSLVLIVLGDQLGQNIGDMYQAALIPGLGLTAVFALYVFALSILRPAMVPAAPPELLTAKGLELLRRTIVVLLPPLILIFLVLGTIFIGLATPTEGGAMGAAGALLLAGGKGRLSRTMVTTALDSTAKLSTFVLFILIGSTIFGLVFQGIHGDRWVRDLLLSLPGGEIGFLLVVNLIVFVLGFFIDFFEIAFILIPLLVPVAQALGIDMVWFGILLAMNMQTSFLSPPFGFALFYLRSVAPAAPYIDRVTGRQIQGITTNQIYRSVVPFIIMQVIMIAVVWIFPEIAVHGPAAGAGVDLNTIQIPTDFGTPATGGGGTNAVDYSNPFGTGGGSGPAPTPDYTNPFGTAPAPAPSP